MAPFSPLPFSNTPRPLIQPPQSYGPILIDSKVPYDHYQSHSTFSSQDIEPDTEKLAESRNWIIGLAVCCFFIVGTLSLLPDRHEEGISLRPVMGQVWDEHVGIGIGLEVVRKKNVGIGSGSLRLSGKEQRSLERRSRKGRDKSEKGDGGAKDRLERMIDAKQGELLLHSSLAARMIPATTRSVTDSAVPVGPHDIPGSPQEPVPLGQSLPLNVGGSPKPSPKPEPKPTPSKTTSVPVFSNASQVDEPNAQRSGFPKQAKNPSNYNDKRRRQAEFQAQPCWREV
jgi:hypothetical protein